MAELEKFDFDEILSGMKGMKRELPILLANQAQKFFTASWKKQGWDDGSIQSWKEVQRRIAGTSAYKYPQTTGLNRRTKPILYNTGTLRRAVSDSIRNATFDLIKLSVPTQAVPYASYLNEGTDRMVARPFMKHSQTLQRMQESLITQKIGGLWRQ